jgi:drug/metabolite transporter (DMT)-like permease
VCLAISINFQQFGIEAYPNEGVAKEARAGFLTALYVILVPIFSVLLRKKISPLVLVGGVVSIVGIYCLLGGKFEGIYLGDVLVFLCAISFALHIMSVDKFVTLTGGVKLSIMQFLVAGIISAILGLIFDTVNWQNVLSCAPQILYLGVMSSGVAYTLQIVGQKYAEPAVASITMSLESVFAALGGMVISGNMLLPNELLGCALVFTAIIIAQIPELLKKNNPNSL